MSEYFSKHFRITPEDFNHRYWELGQSMNEIAAEFGSQGFKLRRHVVKAGIPIKTKQRAYNDRMESGKCRKYFFNEDFFNEWSPAMAWTLGLIASDGNINQQMYRTVFASNDMELIHKYASLLKYTGPITTNNSGCPLVRLSSKKMAHKLVELGITPAKTHTLKYPYIPQHLDSHFIRGFFDGDGNVNINHSGNIPHLRFAITTVAQEFASGLSAKLTQHGLEHAVYRIQAQGNRKPRYNIHAGAFNAIGFFRFIYQDCPMNLCLERKRKVYQDYIYQYGHIYDNGHLVERKNTKTVHPVTNAPGVPEVGSAKTQSQLPLTTSLGSAKEPEL